MEERRRTQRRRKDRDSIVGGLRIIASDHPAVNGLSDTHEGRGHACKGIRMQGRVSPCTRTNAWVNGWPWVGESLRRGQKRREREEPLLAAPSYHPLSLSVSLCVSVRGVVQLSLRLFVSCVLRLEFALTDWLWLVVHPFANSRWSRSLLWVEYNGWDETKPRLLFFFFFIRAWTSFFFFFSLPFLEVCLDREFEQPCFNFVSKFGEVFSFFFLFVAASRTTVWISFLFFNGEVGCSKRGCTANQSGTIFFWAFWFDELLYKIGKKRFSFFFKFDELC